jgi:hypothetical protein
MLGTPCRRAFQPAVSRWARNFAGFWGRRAALAGQAKACPTGYPNLFPLSHPPLRAR